MKHGMRLRDHLDLEWFLEQDRAEAPAQVLARDRMFGLEADLGDAPAGVLVAYWLERRRQGEPGALPSAVLSSGLSALRLILACFGLAVGISLVRALLVYSGTEPVNVSMFLVLAVLPQAALCLAAAGLMVARFLGAGPPRIPLRPLFMLLWRPSGRLSPQTGFVRAMLFGKGGLGRMLAWEGLCLAHIGGLFLAGGALVGTLASVAVTDLAFGWQSTLRIGAQGMHTLVHALALPWNWLPAQWGLTPSLGQIEGSRIVLKEGVETLASADLVSWWPFLCMCLLTYAFLPRALLLVAARVTLRRAENGLVHPDIGRIADRMRIPLVAPGVADEPEHTALPLNSPMAAGPDREVHETRATVGCVLVLPPELQERVGLQDLEALAQRVSGYPPGRIIPADLEPGEARRVLGECAGFVWAGGRERFVVLAEAWQPPIRESLQALSVLGNDGGANRTLSLVLCGRPTAGRWLTTPGERDRAAWDEAVERLAPLRVDVFGADS